MQYRMQYQVPYGNLIYCSSYGKSPFHIATLDDQRIIRNVFGFSSNQLYQLAQPPRYMWADARVLPMKAIQEREKCWITSFFKLMFARIHHCILGSFLGLPKIVTSLS